MLINKKDIIAINQEIGENGLFQNESSLDFALSIIKQKRAWLYELSYLVRSLLVDHVFQDGNKRTAFYIILKCLKSINKTFTGRHKDLAYKIVDIAKSNSTEKEIKILELAYFLKRHLKGSAEGDT